MTQPFSILVQKMVAESGVYRHRKMSGGVLDWSNCQIQVKLDVCIDYLQQATERGVAILVKNVQSASVVLRIDAGCKVYVSYRFTRKDDPR